MSPKSLAEKTKELQRQVILDVAARLFAEEGPHAVTMRKIANESKTSTTVVYNLFGNKQGVVEALFMEGFLLFSSEVKKLDPSMDRFRFLLAMCDLLWDFSREHRHYYRILHGNIFPGFSPAQMKEKMPSPRPLDMVRQAVQDLIEAGFFKSMDVDSVVLSMYSTAVGLINVNMHGLFPDARLDKEKYLSLVESSLRGLSALCRDQQRFK